MSRRTWTLHLITATGMVLGAAVATHSTAAAVSPAPSMVQAPAISPESEPDSGEVDGSSALIGAFFGFLAAAGVAGTAVGVAALTTGRRRLEHERQDLKEERLRFQDRRPGLILAAGHKEPASGDAAVAVAACISAFDNYMVGIETEAPTHEVRDLRIVAMDASRDLRHAVSDLPRASYERDRLEHFGPELEHYLDLPPDRARADYEPFRRHAIETLSDLRRYQNT